MKEESSDEFQNLRKILVERLENTWKDLDEDVLEVIDEILHQHGKKNICLLHREKVCEMHFLCLYGVWIFWRSCWKTMMSQRL